MKDSAPRRFSTLMLILASLCLPASGWQASEQPATIVIGFMGGMVRANNSVHSEAQLATRLERDYPSSVQVRMFENRQGRQAHREILSLLDTDHDGTLSDKEKLDARIAIYGHSWGASEAVTLARSLGREGIPVLLTIQVDSITKLGENDESIPANVAQAVNFYQQGGLFRASVDRVTELETHIDVFVPCRRLRLIYLPSKSLPPTDDPIVDDFILDAKEPGTILRLLGSGIPATEEWNKP